MKAPGGDPVDAKLVPDEVGYRVEYDTKGNLSLSELRKLKRAAAQLRHSLQGPFWITIPYEYDACIKLAKKLGAEETQAGINGMLMVLEDPNA